MNKLCFRDQSQSHYHVAELPTTFLEKNICLPQAWQACGDSEKTNSLGSMRKNFSNGGEAATHVRSSLKTTGPKGSRGWSPSGVFPKIVGWNPPNHPFLGVPLFLGNTYFSSNELKSPGHFGWSYRDDLPDLRLYTPSFFFPPGFFLKKLPPTWSCPLQCGAIPFASLDQNFSLPETNSSHLARGLPTKRKLIWTNPGVSGANLLVSGRGTTKAEVACLSTKKTQEEFRIQPTCHFLGQFVFRISRSSLLRVRTLWQKELAIWESVIGTAPCESDQSHLTCLILGKCKTCRAVENRFCVGPKGFFNSINIPPNNQTPVLFFADPPCHLKKNTLFKTKMSQKHGTPSLKGTFINQTTKPTKP